MTAAPPADGLAEFRRQLRASGGVDLIAADAQGEVIGWVDIQRVPWQGMRHVGSLGMGVRHEWRRRGLGRALLTAALAAAAERDITRVELEVFASNSGAVRLYETAGFAHEGRKHGARQLDGASDDVLVMARRGDGAS
jgi:ribosomal protein S18 acetylase RimI-like enzyme